MLLLVVDTAGPTGGVLLARWDTCVQDRVAIREEMKILGVSDLQPRAFSIQMIPAIADLLRTSDASITDIDAFAAVSGPGSFTGLRVGLTAVKAMAEVTGKPILALSHLAIMASVASRLYPSESVDGKYEDMPIHTILDASRGELYHGIYRNAGETRLSESFETLDTLAANMESGPGLVAVSEPAVRHALGTRNILAREIPSTTVRDAVPLAVVAWLAGDFHDSASLDANYLRRSDSIVVSRPPSARQQAQTPGPQP